MRVCVCVYVDYDKQMSEIFIYWSFSTFRGKKCLSPRKNQNFVTITQIPTNGCRLTGQG